MNFSERGMLPIGFSMSLAQDVKAMTNFATLPDSSKEQLVEYIENSTTGEEAKSRIVEVVNNLHDNRVT